MIAVARKARQIWRATDADVRNIIKFSGASFGLGVIIGALNETEKHYKAKRRNLRKAKRK